MSKPLLQPPEAGLELFLKGETRAFGALLAIAPTLRIYVENAGEFDLPPDAIVEIHDGKVIVDAGRLSGEVLAAARHAHDAEDRD